MTKLRRARLAALTLGGVALFGGLSLAATAAYGDEPAETSADAASVETAAPLVGPAIGEPIPTDLAAADQTGADRTFDTLAGRDGLVLYFSRAASWCPTCQAQMIDLNERFGEFYERGYGVAVVTTDEVEQAAVFAARHGLQYAILSDAGSDIITAWNVRDPAYPEGHRGYGLPYPTTFVIGSDGVVQDALFEAEVYGEPRAYRERVEIDEVLAALDALAAPDSVN